MKILLDKTGMTEADWQEYRRNQQGIGGSDVAVILNLSPYKTAFALWLEKTGQTQAKPVQNEFVEWGNILEPVIREKFRRETGFEVKENPYVMQHDDFDFMVANIDGECFDPEIGEWGILEIKTTSERNKGEWADGPPNHYHLQIQHYLIVMNYSYAYVAVLIGGNHFKYFKIMRDDYVIDKIISAEMEFTQLVKEKIPPEITHADSEALAEAYPEDNDETALMPPELEELAERYIEAQKEVKALQDEIEWIKNKIKFEAKENKHLRGVRFKVSLPTITKILFDSKKFAQVMPETYVQYKTKESSYRGFTVKLVEEK